VGGTRDSVLAGAVLAEVAAHPVISSLHLTDGQELRIHAFRFSQDRVRLSLIFKGTFLARKAELGEWRTPDTPDGLRFPEPGAAVSLGVTAVGHQAVYQAYPVSSHGDSQVTRDLFVLPAGVKVGEYRWPPAWKDAVSLSAGWNDLGVKVATVDARLAEEKVTLVLGAPLTFKSAQKGYSWLWWFFFWPVYAPMLMVIGGILAWVSWQRLRGPPGYGA
jgi:hypothetical protein